MSAKNGDKTVAYVRDNLDKIDKQSLFSVSKRIFHCDRAMKNAPIELHRLTFKKNGRTRNKFSCCAAVFFCHCLGHWRKAKIMSINWQTK